MVMGIIEKGDAKASRTMPVWVLYWRTGRIGRLDRLGGCGQKEWVEW